MASTMQSLSVASVFLKHWASTNNKRCDESKERIFSTIICLSDSDDDDNDEPMCGMLAVSDSELDTDSEDDCSLSCEPMITDEPAVTAPVAEVGLGENGVDFFELDSIASEDEDADEFGFEFESESESESQSESESGYDFTFIDVNGKMRHNIINGKKKQKKSKMDAGDISDVSQLDCANEAKEAEELENELRASGRWGGDRNSRINAVIDRYSKKLEKTDPIEYKKMLEMARA